MQTISVNEMITLRAVEPSDVDFLFAMENDPDNWKVSSTLAPFSRFQLEQYVFSNQHDVFAEHQVRFMIDLCEADHAKFTVGTVDIFDVDARNRRAGVGILVLKEFRRHGIAAAVIQRIIHYAFETLALHQLFCNISADNENSIHLFEKAGFVQCGLKKDWQFTPEGWTDERMYQLVNRLH